MAEDLGARLVRAGLASREQLATALAEGPAQGGSLAARLLDGGVSEEDLVGFFLSNGFGPLLDADELARARPHVLQHITAQMAHTLLALPIRQSAAGLVVAMADPSDVDAVAELRFATGGSVLATVARLSELRAALARFYPDGARRPSTKPSDLPLELVRRRSDPTNPVTLNDRGEPEFAVPLVRPKAFAKPIPLTTKADSGKKVGEVASRSPEAVQPLVQRKAPSGSAASKPSSPQEPSRQSDASADKPAPATRKSAAATPIKGPATEKPPIKKPPVDKPSVKRKVFGPFGEKPPRVDPVSTPTTGHTRSIIPQNEASWGALSESAPANKAAATTPATSVRPAPKRRKKRAPPSGVGNHLASIRASEDRDEIVRHACEAALTVAKSAVLLALKKGVLRGWDARGPSVSPDAIRNLWIPATAPSMFRKVVERGEPHRGPYGSSAADNLYRAATGSRGGRIIIQPIMVAAKPVAVLCAEDAGHGAAAYDRLEVIAHAVGESFKRLIVSTKQ